MAVLKAAESDLEPRPRGQSHGRRRDGRATRGEWRVYLARWWGEV